MTDASAERRFGLEDVKDLIDLYLDLVRRHYGIGSFPSPCSGPS